MNIFLGKNEKLLSQNEVMEKDDVFAELSSNFILLSAYQLFNSN